MLKNHYSFLKKAILSALKLSIFAFFLLIICLVIANLTITIESNYLALYLLLIFQIPISSLEKIECTLLGLNRFKDLINYKLLSSLISLVPLFASLLRINILWIILSIIITRLIVALISLFCISSIIKQMDKKEEKEKYEFSFYMAESQKMSILAAVSTGLNYAWPLILYKIDPMSLSIYFNGNKIPERIKDYSKLFVSIPSQHWLKKGKKHFSEKIKAKGIYIFFASLLFSIILASTARYYMTLLFGEEYAKATLIAQIIFLGIPARVLSNILRSREIFHEKDTAFFRKSNYIQSVINLLLAIPMVYYYREIGLAVHNLLMSYLSYLISFVRFRVLDKKNN